MIRVCFACGYKIKALLLYNFTPHLSIFYYKLAKFLKLENKLDTPFITILSTLKLKTL